MNQEVNKQLIGGGDLTKSIIDGRLPKQQRQTRKKLENNATVKKQKYQKNKDLEIMKYTDPLLLTNNEDLDKSELNDNISQLLEIFHPKQMNNNKMQEVENFVSKKEPVDVNDFANEVMNKSASKIQKIWKGHTQKDLHEAYRDVLLREIEPNGSIRKKTSIYTASSDKNGLMDLNPHNEVKSAKILQAVVRRKTIEKEKRIDKIVKDMETLLRINTVIKGPCGIRLEEK